MVPSQTRTFHNLNDADLVLSDLLIDFFLPTLTAAEAFHRAGASDNISLSISEKFLQDRQKTLFIQMMYSGDLRTNQAGNDLFNVRAVELNQKLLREMDFNLYGDTGTLLKLLISDRLARAERSTQEDFGIEPNDLQLFQRYILPIAADLEHSTDGQFALAILDLKYGLMEEFDMRVRQLLSEDLYKTTNGRVHNMDLASFFIIGLIDNNQWEVAQQLASSDEIIQTNLFQVTPKSALIRMSIKAVIDAKQGNSETYIDLPKNRFKNYPCVEFMTINLMERIVRNSQQRRDLSRLIVESFPKLEAAGITSFEFYNEWGVAETEDGDYDGAIQKFERALKFDGDHAWALLNWGFAAQQKGDMELARTKYSESLAEATILNALYGLLSSLTELHDGEGYLDAFEKYASLLHQASDYEHRSAYQAIASMFGCHLGNTNVPDILCGGSGFLDSGIS